MRSMSSRYMTMNTLFYGPEFSLGIVASQASQDLVAQNDCHHRDDNNQATYFIEQHKSASA